MKTIAIAGTFDTKGEEFAYLKGLIETLGCKTFTINAGVFEPSFTPDVDSNEVAEAIGESIEDLREKNDRAHATAVLAKGMEVLVPKLYKEGKFQGIISLGGSGGASLTSPAMRALPLGVPKVLACTVASGDTTPYVGTSDIVMIPSIVDVQGLNSVSRVIFKNAAAAVVGMTTLNDNFEQEEAAPKPIITATMFGVTTPCLSMAQEYLEAQGYEVLVFHATGTGGKTMEFLINNGFVKGVLDITTTEWCDELFGGMFPGGENRCEAAAKNGIPTVMSVGALDMVNFGPYETVPTKYKERNLYKHNPTITLMRTSTAENTALGKKLAEKLNMSTGKAAMMLPLKGVSAIDSPGAPFHGIEEDKALFQAIRENLDTKKVELIEMDNNINDQEFALTAAKKLLELMNAK